MSGAPAPARVVPTREQITGLVLAGGRGARMGGVDKGLQVFHGVPLALHALQRLRPQVGRLAVNALRNLDLYRSFGVPVWQDALPDHAGPLAGFLAGLSNCETPWLLTVPCDTPLFPADLARRLADAARDAGAELAMASAPATENPVGTQEAAAPPQRPQPVFCLLHCSLQDSLRRYLEAGGRKVGAWAAQQRVVQVPFDDTQAFVNVNTLAELQILERTPRPWPLS